MTEPGRSLPRAARRLPKLSSAAARGTRPKGISPILLLGIAAALLSACSSTPPQTTRPATTGATATGTTQPPPDDVYFSLQDPRQAGEVALYALGLLETGYRFGGRNPAAGLDCSGMVSWVVENISGKRLPHNAAQIAGLTRPIKLDELQSGDLIFFNTLQRPHSHMGIYIGEGRFIHAPSSRGKVRIEQLDNRYFASRIDGVRTLIARD